MLQVGEDVRRRLALGRTIPHFTIVTPQLEEKKKKKMKKNTRSDQAESFWKIHHWVPRSSHKPEVFKIADWFIQDNSKVNKWSKIY